MTIAFRCQNCATEVAVADEMAGLQARCPGCRHYCTVPEPERDDGLETTELLFEEEDEFQLGEMVTCPRCGQLMDAYLGTCETCANRENLRKFEQDSSDEIPTLKREVHKIRLSRILSRSSRLYLQNLFPSLFVTFVTGLLIFASFQAGFYVLVVLIFGGLLGAAAGDSVGLGLLTILLIPGGFILMMFCFTLLSCYFLLGFQAYHLRVVQHQSSGIRDMFRVRPWFWRMYLCGLVLGCLMILGLIFVIVPLILLFFYWPVAFILLDRDQPGICSLSEAAKLIKGNVLRLLVLYCSIIGGAAAGIWGLPHLTHYCEQALALTAEQSASLSLGLNGVFTVLAASFGSMILAVTYAELTGQ